MIKFSFVLIMLFTLFILLEIFRDKKKIYIIGDNKDFILLYVMLIFLAVLSQIWAACMHVRDMINLKRQFIV